MENPCHEIPDPGLVEDTFPADVKTGRRLLEDQEYLSRVDSKILWLTKYLEDNKHYLDNPVDTVHYERRQKQFNHLYKHMDKIRRGENTDFPQFKKE